MTTVIELEKTFIGTGEAKGDVFKQLKSSKFAFVYSRNINDQTIYYEVFQKRVVALCLDFSKRLYSETEFKEIYPTAKDFGITAWCYGNLDKAMQKFESLTK